MAKDTGNDDNLEYLPVWKKGASASERLMELAMMARKNPERFHHMVLIYCDNDDAGITTRYCPGENTDTLELMGLIEMGRYEILLQVRGNNS